MHLTVNKTINFGLLKTILTYLKLFVSKKMTIKIISLH